VLARKAQALAIEQKVLAVFAGCAVVSAACMFYSQPLSVSLAPTPYQLTLLVMLALVLLSVNVAVQFSLARVSANRAIVIYLFELVVAAISSWLLAGEVLTVREWCGGVMIVLAGLFSADLGEAAGGKTLDRASA
jgi:drug/metabolite transporter (DMT)-like permease